MTTAPLPSLRRRMLWRVMLPLALTWLVGSALAMGVAYLYLGKAFDRSLLDDAYAIAANVGLRDGELTFQLSAQEVGAVLFDRDERVFFAVLRGDGSLLSGQVGLRNAAVDPAEPVAFEDRHYRGVDLRVVTLTRQQPLQHAVVVGQTVRSRTRLVGQMLLASVVPQALLLLLLGAWLRQLVARELKPLQQLEAALAQRSSSELAPVHLPPDLAPRSRDIASLAEAFNALMARIAAGVKAQREFAGNVAHELRTPLAGIRSLADYGLAQKDAAVVAEQLRRIVHSEQRASHLVDQLLALALADEAGQSLQLEPLQLDTLLHDQLLRLLPRADAAGVDLGAAGLDAPLAVLGHAALVEGIVANLVDNALRYGRPAEGAARITVEAAASDDAVDLSVTDNGPGMAADERARALERWAQGGAGQQLRSGVGLGLAIVARYAALLGARLELADAAPGLRATVHLQRAPAQ